MKLWRMVGGGGTIAAVGLLTWTTLAAPPQDGELVAQDTQSQINLRAQANTQSDIVGLGKVGDRLQVLERLAKSKEPGWYRIKLLRTGQLGWVRADFIKIGRPPQPTVTPQKSAAPMALKPPVAGPPLAPKQPTIQPDSTQTLVAFSTPTYAVRVFSEAGHLRLNLFNRHSNVLALQAVPLESQTAQEATIYRYISDVKVTVTVPTAGTPTLTTFALGNTLQEAAESSAVPSPAAAEPAPKATP